MLSSNDNHQDDCLGIRKAYVFERKMHESLRSAKGDIGRDYEQHIPNWDGGIDKWGVNHKSAWERIKNFSDKHGLDPANLIKGVFYFAKKGSPSPTPSQCCGAYALKCYENFIQISVAGLSSIYDAYKRNANIEMWKLKQNMPSEDPEVIWRIVIVSPTLKCSSLFRYCLACNTGQTDLASEYEQEASLEYLRYADEFDNFLGADLPIEFKTMARKYQSSLAG